MYPLTAAVECSFDHSFVLPFGLQSEVFVVNDVIWRAMNPAWPLTSERIRLVSRLVVYTVLFAESAKARLASA